MYNTFIILFSHIACNHLHDYLHQSILLLLQLLPLVPHCVLNSAIIMLYTFPFIPKKSTKNLSLCFLIHCMHLQIYSFSQSLLVQEHVSQHDHLHHSFLLCPLCHLFQNQVAPCREK